MLPVSHVAVDIGPDREGAEGTNPTTGRPHLPHSPQETPMSERSAYGHEVRIRIGGPAGFGIKAAGQMLARVFARGGYHTFDLTEYPSLIKGGHNTYHLRVSEEEIFSHVMATDILVALDAATIPLHLGELTQGGAIVFDPKDVAAGFIDLGGRRDICLVPIPLTDIVSEVGGVKIMRNVAALGAVLGQMGYPLGGLLDSLRAQFAHKAPRSPSKTSRRPLPGAKRPPS